MAKAKPAIPCGTAGFNGAAGRIRTADLILTKDALYRLSYSSEYGDLEGAFPPSFGWLKKFTSTKKNMATRKGLEPSTSGVTGRRSNQLNYRAILAGAEGLEPSARGFGDRCSTN